MMITILRISSVYLITYIISLCGRKTRAHPATPIGATPSVKSTAAQPSTISKHPPAGGPAKGQSGDEEDDFKFQLNIKKSENKKQDDFDDDDEENPLVKLSVKQRKKMAGSMRQKANHAKASEGGKTVKKAATGASVMESPADDQEQNLFGGTVGTSQGVSCYQFEVKKSMRKMKSAKNAKPVSPAVQPPAAPPAKVITSGEKPKNSAEKQKPVTPDAAGAGAGAKTGAMSEKTKQTQRTAVVAMSEKKTRPPLVISPAPVDKGGADKNGGSISRAVSVTQITEEVVREDSLKDKDKEPGDLKPVEFSTSPGTKR